ncbi:uncharacterized protein PGTG_06185 [Puccinia graminis f. sp. tritici CRL 75-36-700-3]|uniref:Uncharacterized protein n=1 Tax=Puccinia graminis f. sp. tritici (strain CRL 75-36-700-3 / race SCCL) TaxID=418459 RepID=E3K823_PUCGT|nr:uncharacterized protein PGTG_06185 [Puccinia graminis f. sp. tritici CRL 75-36-700-3]EFP80229.1 hypothetical protein PGTG_06185 [Puccinia graminis f. sp. tritici CRL 75-36-700-3]
MIGDRGPQTTSHHRSTKPMRDGSRNKNVHKTAVRFGSSRRHSDLDNITEESSQQEDHDQHRYINHYSGLKKKQQEQEQEEADWGRSRGPTSDRDTRDQTV